VLKASTTITWTAPADITYGTALSATQLNATANVPGRSSTARRRHGAERGREQTLSVTFTPTDAPTTRRDGDDDDHRAEGEHDDHLDGAGGHHLRHGAERDAAECDRQRAGTFVYTPAAGTVLNAGANQTLSVTFTPTDAANYTGATATTTITVLKASTTISWTAPADITYGTALSATQLNATANVPGTFVYRRPPARC
jgi:hypothetical protein